MPHPYFHHAALAVGLIPPMMGVQGLLQPEAVLKSVHFPIPADPEARKVTRSLMRLFAVRNLAVGYFNTLMWYTGNGQFMGIGLLSLVVLSLVDGFIINHQVGKGMWNHLGLTPVIAGIAAGLLGWF